MGFEYSGISFSVAGEDVIPQGIAWDGTHFWVVGNSTDAVYKYDSAGVYTGTSFSVAGEDTGPQEIVWDGTHFWVVGNLTDAVYKYDSSGVYTGISFSVAGEDATPQGIAWDGTHFWVVGSSTDAVYEYDSSGVYTGISFSVAGEEVTPTGIVWDGFSFSVVGASTDAVYKYKIPVPQIDPMPTAPSRTDSSAVFKPLANAFVAAMDPFGVDNNTQADFTDAQAEAAALSAFRANQSVFDAGQQVVLAADQVALASDEADRAEVAATDSASSANFVGNWVDQTGAANIPYSVFNNNDTWNLVNNLADVTTSEPGVTADWVRVAGGSRVLVETVVLAGDTFIDLDLPDGFSLFIVECVDMQGSATSFFRVRTSSDAGVSFDTGASDYSFCSLELIAGVGSTTVQQNAANDGIIFGRSDACFNCTITLYDPLFVGNTHMTMVSATEQSGVENFTTGSGMRDDVATVDAIRLDRFTGTMTTGTIILYGVV